MVKNIYVLISKIFLQKNLNIFSGSVKYVHEYFRMRRWFKKMWFWGEASLIVFR